MIVNGVWLVGLQLNLEYMWSWYYLYDSVVLKDFLDFQFLYRVEVIVDMLKLYKVVLEGWYMFLMEGDFVDCEKMVVEMCVVICKIFNEFERVISVVE